MRPPIGDVSSSPALLAESSLTNVPTAVAKLLGQLVHHVLEDDRIHVLAEQVEEEPVADHGLLYDDVEALGFDPSKPARQRPRRSTPMRFKLNFY